MLDLAEQVVKGRPYRVADFTSPAGLVIADAIKAAVIDKDNDKAMALVKSTTDKYPLYA